MQQHIDTMMPRKTRRIFYFATITLLLGAITLAFIQKQHEIAVAIGGMRGRNVQTIAQDAKHWGILSLATVSLAVSSFGIAIWRREEHRWVWVPVVVLLSLYVLLELMIV